MEIIKPVDPIKKTLDYIKKFYPETEEGTGKDAVRAAIEPPSDWDWAGLLFTVADVGGAGFHDYVLDNVFLSIMVSHPDSIRASDIARTLHGLLIAWSYSKDRVYWRGSLQRPMYTPDDVTEVPAYTMTVSLDFRATTEEVTESG